MPPLLRVVASRNMQMQSATRLGTAMKPVARLIGASESHAVPTPKVVTERLTVSRYPPLRWNVGAAESHKVPVSLGKK